MATWIRCTNEKGVPLQVNFDHVAIIRPHYRDGDFAGSELVFAAGNLSSIVVIENEDHLMGPLGMGRGPDQL